MDEKDRKGLERVFEEIATYEAIIMGLEAAPNEMTHLHLPLAKMVLWQHQKTVECIEQRKPLAASYFSNCPEIFTAMDIHWYQIIAQSFGGGMENPHIMEDLEGVDKLSVATDVCTLLRLALYYLDAGILPRPTVLLPLIEPCDGVIGLHEAIRKHKHWRGIPTFTPDPPYYNDERSINYFADELRRMVDFLQKETGQSVSMERLKQIVEITNEQYELWMEYIELRRSIPCPHGITLAFAGFPMVQTAGAGDPGRTQWFKDVLADAEKRIKENNPEMPNQKIRLLWSDVQPIWINSLTPWLEEEWGATLVLCMFSYTPYTLIDTSSETSIFQGLAKRNFIDPPMIRQARGFVDNFLYDLERIIIDYKIDVVLHPGHMGHKDGCASIGLYKEKAQEAGAHLLSIGVDNFDRRYMTIDQIKDRISQFFSALGYGK